MHRKLLISLRYEIFNLLKSLNARIIQSCNNFEDFTGRDIDAFYRKKNKSFRILKNYIVQNKNENDLRFHLNHPSKSNFLSIDVQDILALPRLFRNEFTENFYKKSYCKKTRLNHLDEKSIIFYKLFKYFTETIISYDQLKKLKKKIVKLDNHDYSLILNSSRKVLTNEFLFIEKFFKWKFKKFQNNKNIKNFFSKKKINRQKKRIIFAGEIKLKKIFFSKKFLYALTLGNLAKWRTKHNPMPALAIVGNDGSGKTSIVEHIRKNFSKMDPLIFNMKVSDAYFPFFEIVRKNLKKTKEYKFIKKINFLNFIISAIGEMLSFVDRYIKYRIGMAWADSGRGLTIFERYPTDRVRGEFPNKTNKWLPFEQFFPFPDGILYLDVLPKDSLKRKKKDRHSYEEMKSKRENYLKLLKELNEVKVIKSSENIDKKIKLTKNYIFDLYLKKKKKLVKDGKNTRVIWKKNYKRVLAGKKLNKSQKASFFGHDD